MLRSDMHMVFQDPMASLNPQKDFGYYCDGSRCASSSYGSKERVEARVQNDGDGRFKSSLYETVILISFLVDSVSESDWEEH